MNPHPVITGLGLITPLGPTVPETWKALLEGASVRGHVRLSPESFTNYPRVTSLSLVAALEALSQARWKTTDERTAIIVGTSKGPIEAWLAPPHSTSDKPSSSGGRPEFGLASIATAIANEVGLHDAPRLTLSAACASGLHALIRGAMMIRTGEAARVLVVAAEASVHPLFLGSFNRLGVLPPEGVPCRPFDLDRRGFLMSEAAAAVCLEAYDSSTAPATKPIAAVERFAMGGDAEHLTAGDPSGATLRYLLDRVVGHRAVDLMHAHGTGTAFNDPIELSAIEAVVGSTLPTANSTSDNQCYVKFDGGAAGEQMPVAIYSHKGALGHSLGASGLVSVVLNCQAHLNGVVPPNVNTQHPLPTRWTSIQPVVVRREIRRSLVCATGFGGPTSVVSLISS